MVDANGHRRRPRSRTRLLSAGLIVASVLAFGGLAAGASSAATPRDFYGIVANSNLDNNDFARMGSAGVGSFRLGVAWPNVQTARNGPFSWASTDPLMAGIASQHIKPLMVLSYTPAFVANGCTSVECVDHINIGTKTKQNDWKAFVKAAVRRYGPSGSFWQENPGLPYDPATRWQIWNEQNNPNQKNSPKLYAKLVKISANTITSIQPKAKIITGGMFGAPPAKKGGITAWDYLAGLYKHGVGDRLDGVALHPYAPNIAGLKEQIENIRKVLKKHHHSSVKTYVTEIGWGSSKKVHPGTGRRGAAFNVGPKKQKENLKKSFKLLTSHRKGWKIGGVYWFSWKDPSNPPAGLCAFCYSSGLYQADGTTAKPALSAYENFTRK
jgi:hypothetical protein